MTAETAGTAAEELERPRFRIIPTTELPVPHNPFRCHHAQRFAHELHAADGDHETAGAAFTASLTDRDRAACSFHRGDWASIARHAEVLFRGHGEDPDTDVVAADIDRLPLCRADARWLWSLFDDPILIASNGREFTNGQHRACALRFSGHPAVLVAR